jgi:4-diphosphocytidyl-2-C-methyl-D-erythritol kinase
MKTLVIEAPAKINLFLDVKGKRNDGYHELESIMHQINLVDRINIQVDDGITVKSPNGDRNN